MIILTVIGTVTLHHRLPSTRVDVVAIDAGRHGVGTTGNAHAGAGINDRDRISCTYGGWLVKIRLSVQLEMGG